MSSAINRTSRSGKYDRLSGDEMPSSAHELLGSPETAKGTWMVRAGVARAHRCSSTSHQPLTLGAAKQRRHLGGIVRQRAQLRRGGGGCAHTRAHMCVRVHVTTCTTLRHSRRSGTRSRTGCMQCGRGWGRPHRTWWRCCRRCPSPPCLWMQGHGGKHATESVHP